MNIIHLIVLISSIYFGFTNSTPFLCLHRVCHKLAMFCYIDSCLDTLYDNNGPMHQNSPLPLWNIYQKLFTQGVWISSELDHKALPHKMCTPCVVFGGGGPYSSMIWVGTCCWNLKSRPIFIPNFAKKLNPFLYQSHKF